jgi:hypothetical protein
MINKISQLLPSVFNRYDFNTLHQNYIKDKSLKDLNEPVGVGNVFHKREVTGVGNALNKQKTVNSMSQLYKSKDGTKGRNVDMWV